MCLLKLDNDNNNNNKHEQLEKSQTEDKTKMVISNKCNSKCHTIGTIA